MAKFAETYPDEQFVQQVVAQIPWGQNIVLLDKVNDDNTRRWYAEKTIENGWTRNVLTHQIESNLYTRQVLANKVSNFENRLPSPQSELAVQTMKDPYIFDFIPFREDMSKPIGVSEYKITSNLPEELLNQLPSVEDIQKRIK